MNHFDIGWCYCLLSVALLVFVCVFSSHSFWTSMDVPAGVTQEEGNTGFSIHLSAVLAFIFLARRIQPFLSLVDREVEFCVLTNLIVLQPLGIFYPPRARATFRITFDDFGGWTAHQTVFSLAFIYLQHSRQLLFSSH